MLHGRYALSRRWPGVERSRPGSVPVPLDKGGPGGKHDESVAHLNRSLHLLATIFPRILPEVFREMLSFFSGESRLHVIVDQLLRHQDRWVKGRWRTTVPIISNVADETVFNQTLVAVEDEFRRTSYARAVKTALYQEFDVLSKSRIDAILSEANSCYTHARPTLERLASKSWKTAVKTFWASWKPSYSEEKSHYMLDWIRSKGNGIGATPVLRKTGDVELDIELTRTVLTPLLETLKAEQEAQDQEVAERLNENEAREANAIYECECCYGDTIFEQMATCSSENHVICFQCIRHAVNEVLFGQGWGRNIDHATGEIRCLAPTLRESCLGHVAQPLARRAVLGTKGGIETYRKFEARVAGEALLQAQIPLVGCPFCDYAEVDDLYYPRHAIHYRPRFTNLRWNSPLLALTVMLLPVIVLYSLLSHLLPFFTLPYLSGLFSKSLARLSSSRHSPMRFQCRSPRCGQPSCIKCFKVWNNPHVCHESATLSLRTTIEAARTTALKRTCPQCGVAFVKDSGCNKLTCVCGYIMCYICRQGLGKGEGGEGYRHFCQHFRPQGGVCKDCDKCDLYKNLDDDVHIREVGAKAEKEWREREGMIGVAGLVDEREGAEKLWPRFARKLQDMMDCWAAEMVTC